ncbi:MAG TPA: hypothetical protein PKD37_01740 [Oligoflexia bacterium]|nr:hypothetical protein [Oligoflexia bacterium]HMP26699.1 hypothetical protein [Oligoflexia bacterium]
MKTVEKNYPALKIGDRVSRNIELTNKETNNILGTVQAIKSESSGGQPTDDPEKSLMVIVSWDNGAVSYMAPAGLTLVK